MQTSDIEFLQSSLPFWRQLAPKDKQLLLDTAMVRHFKSGDFIHRGSEDCSGLFLLLSGQVRSYIFSDTGKEITLYRLFERDICIFSASCIMKNISFEMFIEAEKDTKAILIPTGTYSKLLLSSIEMSNYINQLMSSRFSEVMWVMEQVIFMSFDERLAFFLCEQVNIEESTTLHITHETIAKHLGSAREVVTRMLKYFSSEGMVELSRGEIRIVDRKSLQKVYTK